MTFPSLHGVKNRNGFTLMELLIVIAILVILMAVGFTNWMAQIKKGYDVRRKSDLSRLKIMLENYYNDRGCFPTYQNWIIQACGYPIFFMPSYPEKFPCDPETKTRYVYEPILNSAGDPCDGYRLFTKLKNPIDSDIQASGCGSGCGPGFQYNYGVTSGVPIQ